MIEKICANKTLLALIIRNAFARPGVNFLTPKQSPLQLGVSLYAKGTELKAHAHKRVPRRIIQTQEILHVAGGKARVDIYSGAKKAATRVLNSGDTILFLCGGHGLKLLSNTKLIEIKQGPYLDKKADKRYVRLK